MVDALEVGVRRHMVHALLELDVTRPRQQLRELESDEIIIRKVYKEVPPKVEYSLTLLGKSVIPVIDLLREWGEEYRGVFIK